MYNAFDFKIILLQNKPTSYSPVLERSNKIMTPLERRTPFNERSWEMNIFGIWGLCCASLFSPFFKNNSLPLKIDWITFEELWQAERESSTLWVCAPHNSLLLIMTDSLQSKTCFNHFNIIIKKKNYLFYFLCEFTSDLPCVDFSSLPLVKLNAWASNSTLNFNTEITYAIIAL